MTEDYSRVNQAVTLIIAAVLNVVSLLEQTNKASATRYVAIDLENAAFSIPI